MKVSLSVAERIGLLNILPREGNIITLKIVKELREKLSFSEEEIKEWEIRVEGQNITWNNAKAKEKEIEIGDASLDIIRKSLNELNEKNKLNESHISIWEKFMEK